MAVRSQKSFLLLLLTTSVAWMVPLAFVYYAFPVVPVIRTATLTSALVVGLLFFTSWAGKKGHDLSFLGPFLLLCFVAILVLVLVEVIMGFTNLEFTNLEAVKSNGVIYFPA